ncbi:MAG: oligopeptidase B, partial [Thermoanaerobaculia bacterium]
MSEPSAPEPPVAKRVPHELENHGHVRVDDYYWLKERENPEVTAYLAAENDYTKAVMVHAEELQESLYREIVARIKKDDESVPYKLGDYYYYERYVEGGEYPLFCRKRSLEPAEEVMLDVNRMARGHVFF